MNTPDVLTEMKDTDINFTFVVRAYRSLSEMEIKRSYALWRRQKKSNKPKKNQRVEVITSIGAND